DDVVDSLDNLTSLREALALANADPATPHTITFDPSLKGGTLFLAPGLGQLVISTDVTIDGDIGHDGTADITISADSAAGANHATSRVFTVDDGTTGTISAALNGLTIRDGHENVFGGGILVGLNDPLSLTNTTVTANTSGIGGGIL